MAKSSTSPTGAAGARQHHPGVGVSAKRPPITDSAIGQMLLKGNAAQNATAEQWDQFLIKMMETGNATESAKAAGFRRETAYARRWEDSDFAAAWDRAREIGLSRLEEEAVRRAHDGVDEPVFYQGEEVATVKKFSDPLLMFLLQGNDKRYARKQEITGANGGPLAILAAMDDESLDILIKQREQQLKELDE